MKKRISVFLLILLSLGLAPLTNQSSEVNATNTSSKITYQTHVQHISWQKPVKEGEMAGTTGRSFRLEGFRMNLVNQAGSVEYSAHVQRTGWQNYSRNGSLTGTTGKSLRLEAIKIRLSGDVANKYNVQYRVYVQGTGWQSWKSNDEVAGTTGKSLRLEAIEVKLSPKNQTAQPESTNRVVDLAYKQLGIPYVWGGTTRAGFDCSGLTQYVYRNALGKNIGRVTTNQEYAGTKIPVSKAKPGDLLFWGARGSTYHVAIYVGNGNYIHAPEPGKKVKVQNMSWYAPSFAVRVN